MFIGNFQKKGVFKDFFFVLFNILILIIITIVSYSYECIIIFQDCFYIYNYCDGKY